MFIPRKSLGATAVLLLAAGVFLEKVPDVVMIVYALMSIIAIIVYAIDKSAAEKGQWRTPESTLQMIALLGGWPGALFAQDILRHKTKKTSFQFIFWLAVAVNVGALAWLLTYLNR